jgi:hypothetical protein
VACATVKYLASRYVGIQVCISSTLLVRDNLGQPGAALRSHGVGRRLTQASRSRRREVSDS